MSKGIKPLYRPIIVPAFTRDPDEVCLCPNCEDAPQLVRQGNRLVCPNGCGEYVLILPPIEKQTKRIE